MKIYVTFGQLHVHSVNGKTFDKDCVAVVEADTFNDGHAEVQRLFGRKYCFTYGEDNFCMDDMEYYPRGFIPVMGDPK